VTLLAQEVTSLEDFVG